MKGISLLLICLVLIGCFPATSSAVPTVQTRVKANWFNKNFLLQETSEFFASEDPALFWLLADCLAERQYPQQSESLSDESQYSLLLQCASLLNPSSSEILSFALATRYFSPAMEAYLQFVDQVIRPEYKRDNCLSFVEIGGSIVCSVEELKEAISGNKLTGVSVGDLDLGHWFGRSRNLEAPVLILYAPFASKDFYDFHSVLKKLALDHKISYLYRHVVQADPESLPAFLSGYGVELQIKSTEYKAVDDESGSKSFSAITPLKSRDIPEIGIKIANAVMSSPTPLEALRDISQNLPSRASKIAETRVSEQFWKTHNQVTRELASVVNEGHSRVWLNGISLNIWDIDETNVYSLFPLLQEERRKILSLSTLLKGKANALHVASRGAMGGDMPPVVFNVQFPPGAPVVHLNDLETDQKYQNWPSSIREILNPNNRMGPLKTLRKNLYNTLFVVDPSEIDQLLVFQRLQMFLERFAPLRMTVLLVIPDASPEDEEQVQAQRFAQDFSALFHFFAGIDPQLAVSFASHFVGMYSQIGVMSEDLLQTSFATLAHQGRIQETYDSVVSQDSPASQQAQQASALAKQRRFPAGSLYINGEYMSYLGPNFEQRLVSVASRQVNALRDDVSRGKLTDNMNILDYLMAKKGVISRFSRTVFSSDPVVHAQISVTQLNSFPAIPFFLPRQDARDKVITNTMVVVTDLKTPEGLKLALEALSFMNNAKSSRLTIVPNHSVSPRDSLELALFALFQEGSEGAFAAAQSLLQTALDQKSVEAELESLHFGFNLKDQPQRESLAKKLQEQVNFISQITSLKKNSRLILCNSRILSLDSDAFDGEDFTLFEQFESVTRALPLYNEIASLRFPGLDPDALTSEWYSDLTWKVSLILNAGSKEYSRDRVPNTAGASFSNKRTEDFVFEVVAVVNPFSLEAQTISSILLMLDELFEDCKISVFLNPFNKVEQQDSAPLKRFYRFAYQTKLAFTESGALKAGSYARFENLPENLLLTLGMEIPRSWLVFSTQSAHDLDNIILQPTETEDVVSEFELKNLLVEGHCYDTTQNPPRGLQFVLGTPQNPNVVDTIVMANLGYFQFKANPGVWQLRLRSGRSSDIYTFDVRETEYHLQVVSTFRGGFSHVTVRRRPGKENEQLLVEEPQDGIWSRMMGGERAVATNPHADINVFSVASGHMYERLLRIMIVSVMKHTTSTVKFWFIENFLSPSFKNSLPLLAETYNFKYQYVTYKWPKWLRFQKEKQRLIWGYKILFLDVLFPLDLDKVIFVDADQTVRADLKELVDMNLQGAPYAYTPFCDSNKDVEGYRFWKQGWWSNFLGGKPYYISALYVVDLKRFRTLAAGDRLRGQYHQLSADPNSLANLDQDLPNHMQHHIPIFTLPQEWLWCETWCSRESLVKAKTIDLCNNPMTKEPKLTMATRIVDEWSTYDNEIKDLLKTLPASEAKRDAPKSRDEL